VQIRETEKRTYESSGRLLEKEMLIETSPYTKRDSRYNKTNIQTTQ